MEKIEEYVKRIIEKLITRSTNGSFEITDKITFLRSFKRIGNDPDLEIAFDELVRKRILIRTRLSSFNLNTYEFIEEIRRIKNIEPIGSRSQAILPMKSYFDGYVERFNLTTLNSWPHRGTYYCCTNEADISEWKAIYRANPTKRPLVYQFGSFQNENSRIVKMWRTILKVWDQDNREPIWKKKAEDVNQKDFGNNRQAGTAAFEIFRKFGWLHEVSKKRKQVFYQIDKPEEYLDILAKKIPFCLRCAMPARDNFCITCDLPV